MIRGVLPTLLKHGQVTRSWVGIYVQPVSEAHAQKVGLGKARGALVSEVVDGAKDAEGFLTRVTDCYGLPEAVAAELLERGRGRATEISALIGTH